MGRPAQVGESSSRFLGDELSQERAGKEGWNSHSFFGERPGFTPFFHMPPPPIWPPGNPGASALLWQLWGEGSFDPLGSPKELERGQLLGKAPLKVPISSSRIWRQVNISRTPHRVVAKVNQLSQVYTHLLGENVAVVIFALNLHTKFEISFPFCRDKTEDLENAHTYR